MTAGRRSIELTDDLLRTALSPAAGLRAPEALRLAIGDAVRTTRQPRPLVRMPEPPVRLFGPRAATPAARLAWAAVLAALLVAATVAAAALGSWLTRDTRLVVAPTATIGPGPRPSATPAAAAGPDLSGASDVFVAPLGADEAWISVDNALWHLDAEVWSGPIAIGGLSPDTPWARDVVAFPDGPVLVATSEGVFARDVEGSWTQITEWWTNDLAVAPDGSVWAASGMGLLAHLTVRAGTGWTWTRVDCPGGGWLVGVAADGTAWTGGIAYNGTQGLARIRDGTCEGVPIPAEMGRAEVAALAVAPDGIVYAQLTDEGIAGDGAFPLASFDGRDWRRILLAPWGGVPRLTAPDGALWTTGPGGLLRFDERWVVVDPEIGTLDAIGPDGTVWYRTADGLRTTSRVVAAPTARRDRPNPAVWMTVVGASRDDAWVVQGLGLWRVTAGSWSVLDLPVSPAAWVRDVLVAPPGVLWLATTEGVWSSSDGRTWAHPWVTPISDLALGPDGTVYATGEDAVLVAISGGGRVRSLKGCAGQLVAVGGDGRVWVAGDLSGTVDDVALVNDSGCTTLGSPDAIPSRTLIDLTVGLDGAPIVGVADSGSQAYYRWTGSWSLVWRSTVVETTRPLLDPSGTWWTADRTHLLRLDGETWTAVASASLSGLSFAPDGTLWYVGADGWPASLDPTAR